MPRPGRAGQGRRRGRWPSPAAPPRTPGCTRSAAALDRARRGDPRGQRPRRRRRPRLGLNAAAIDRLTLNPKRIDEMARAPRSRSPRCPTRSARSSRRAGGPTGWRSRQVRVPLGVIFMIYESRPNVTVDAAALCVKSGNAAILRGGKEAIHSNRALHRVLADELEPGRPARATPSSSSRRPTARPSATCCALPELHRPGHPPRRREPDPPRRRRGRDAGPEALHGQLPRLRRRRRRPRDGRPDRRQRQGPAPRRLQRRRDPARPPRGRPELPPRASPRPSSTPASSSAATPPAGPSCRP